MSPVRSYTNWNSRSTDYEKQIEPYRKYFFICEGANTETWYFRKLIDIRKFLNIHPLIDIRLLEKTEEDKDISFPRKLIAFAENQKKNPEKISNARSNKQTPRNQQDGKPKKRRSVIKRLHQKQIAIARRSGKPIPKYLDQEMERKRG